MARRLSITKLQRESAAGAELLSICQTVTADGHLADEEVAALRQWAVDHADVGLPAQSHLQEVIDRILADGVITDDERAELYEAIERVLPPDIRALAKSSRRAVEQAARDEERQREAEAAAAIRAERERNGVLDDWNFMVAGVRYEGRPAIISAHVTRDCDVYLVRDRGNRFSANAVAILLPNGMQIGFVPEAMAKEMAPMLDQGHPYIAWVTKVLTGGRSPIPVVQADLYRTDTTHTDLVRPGNEPVSLPRAGRSGCLSTALLAAGILAAWIK